MDNVGTGLGRLSASAEKAQNEAAIKGFEKRIKDNGVVGTHSLGVEFESMIHNTWQDAVRSEDINEFHANI